MNYLIPPLAGFLGGVLGPLIGVGGGVIIVPLLNFSGFSFQASVAASLFSIVITSLISVLTRGRAVLRYARYAAAPAAAAILASILSVKYGGPVVERLYGIYLLSIAILMYLSPRAARPRPLLGGFLIVLGGLVSAAFGIGGGTIYMPALTMLMRLEAKEATAVSMALILPTTLAGVISYAVQGVLIWPLAVLVATFSALGSFLTNKYIIKKVKSKYIYVIFILYSIATGIYYLMR